MATGTQSGKTKIIAGELQASIRKAAIASGRSAAGLLSSELEGPIDVDLGMLRSTSDISGTPFTSHRRLLGPFIIAIKNIVRELLVQVLDRQSTYNGAAVRALTHLKRRIDSIAEDQARIGRRLAALEARVGMPVQSASRRAQATAAQAFQPIIGEAHESESAGFDDRLDAVEDAIARGSGRGPPRA
jgi:hypothetical protein